MKKFVFVYYGKGVDSDKVSPEDMKKSMDSWMKWFDSFKEKMVDGGNPFSPEAKSVTSHGVEDVTAKPATGYTIVNANNMDEATEIAKGCPVLNEAGTVHVYEALPM